MSLSKAMQQISLTNITTITTIGYEEQMTRVICSEPMSSVDHNIHFDKSSLAKFMGLLGKDIFAMVSVFAEKGFRVYGSRFLDISKIGRTRNEFASSCLVEQAY